MKLSHEALNMQLREALRHLEGANAVLALRLKKAHEAANEALNALEDVSYSLAGEPHRRALQAASKLQSWIQNEARVQQENTP